MTRHTLTGVGARTLEKELRMGAIILNKEYLFLRPAMRAALLQEDMELTFPYLLDHIHEDSIHAIGWRVSDYHYKKCVACDKQTPEKLLKKAYFLWKLEYK